ncbi:hypothetical protein CpipJ_CPIJ002345 [Culex quinquefasciatus]|uniref:Uncharacterized protein n=1 Tax=Culex quinquefasciatus TaxID=7176 RepID=B0W5N0_CULQU|nr:hypothetical protein CpipJ_CPIJ002345 [Culex quinquefasciatus]|eukprot:XP_001844014.1 hypothetical protein CpipJ_CPIJ002345 [Culex quinquefasciatus]
MRRRRVKWGCVVFCCCCWCVLPRGKGRPGKTTHPSGWRKNHSLMQIMLTLNM